MHDEKRGLRMEAEDNLSSALIDLEDAIGALEGTGDETLANALKEAMGTVRKTREQINSLAKNRGLRVRLSDVSQANTGLPSQVYVFLNHKGMVEVSTDEGEYSHGFMFPRWAVEDLIKALEMTRTMRLPTDEEV